VEYGENVVLQLFLPAEIEQSLQEFCAANHMLIVKP
jgi:hypothetical protein